LLCHPLSMIREKVGRPISKTILPFPIIIN
jgi:hypothetical protein